MPAKKCPLDDCLTVSVEQITTNETDETLVMQPNGSGGVEFNPIPEVEVTLLNEQIQSEWTVAGVNPDTGVGNISIPPFQIQATSPNFTPGKTYLVNFAALVELQAYYGGGGTNPIQLKIVVTDSYTTLVDLWEHDFTADGEFAQVNLSAIFVSNVSATSIGVKLRTDLGSGANATFDFTNGVFNIIQLD